MFATVRGWPASHLPVDGLRAQVRPGDREIIVMDGSGLPPPDAEAAGVDVTWHSRPGRSVFQLRAEGYELCRGEIVAVIEDHVVPASDWCEKLLAAHAAHPEAIAIAGSIENGTTAHLVDWASFIMTQVHSVGPLEAGQVETIGGPPTVSYKRAVLGRRPTHGALGAIELFDNAGLRRPGEVLLHDDSIRVSHHQSLGIAATAALEFHNGRTVAAFRRRSMSRGDWMRIVVFPILPIYRTVRTARIAWGKWLPRSAIIATLPMQLALHYVQAAGEMVGYATGAGSSPHKVR